MRCGCFCATFLPGHDETTPKGGPTLAHESPRESAPPPKEFKPYISPSEEIAEFTPKAIIFGSLFGIIFGASTVYLALKAEIGRAHV